jgi:deoxyribodipyrimidine photo-lyase
VNHGFLSRQEIAQKIKSTNNGSNSDSIDVFLEELIIRAELAENFCCYCEDYDSTACFPDWAKSSLEKHSSDTREHLYSTDELEFAKTHDEAWNASQKQLVVEGKMHGYMRMYWAKKILEWTDNHEVAHQTAIYLNDKYELDGRDPGGFTGIAWAIGGVHDQGWKERDIFGKVRYMNYKGLKRKFDIESYEERYKNVQL